MKTGNKDKSLFRKAVGIAVLLAVCLAIFFLFPNKSVINKYMMKVVNVGCIYYIAVLGLSVMLGLGGQVTFSTAGIMGVGAYISAVLTTQFGWGTLPALLMAVLVGAAFSYLIGLALFRLKGSYFAFASIGLNSLLYTIMVNWKPVTGGPDGISNIPSLNVGPYLCSTYYSYFRVCFLFVILCSYVVYRIRKTYLGRALSLIRDNEIEAQCMGVNVYHTKIISFVFAGIFASLAGGLYAFHAGYISPGIFKFEQSAIYLIMVMLGGVDSTLGAFLGAMLLTILPEQMRFLSDYYQLVYGIGVIILMVVMPLGIVGAITACLRKLRRLRRKKRMCNTKEGDSINV